jgi:hypothetical protein
LSVVTAAAMDANIALTTMRQLLSRNAHNCWRKETAINKIILIYEKKYCAGKTFITRGGQ